MSQEYNPAEMRAMSVDYVQRVYDASSASTAIKLKKEPMVLKLSKVDLVRLTAKAECDGVYAIFGLEESATGVKTQTTILVPYNSTGKAIPLGSGSEIKGIEKYDGKSPQLHEIIHPSGAAVNIVQGVDEIYDDMGIN
ncbi:MAG: hypothetical protein ACI8XB_001066 [Patiriisocius sp.]|jgi:hypothetical protein